MQQKNPCEGCKDASCAAKDKRPNESDKDFQARQALEARMCQIKHKLVVLSGKGGVGKSTVSANLATALAMRGKKVGLLDVDLHGPSIPRLFKIEGHPVEGTEANTLLPVSVFDNLQVMSIGLLLRSVQDAVIWRGPMKHNAIGQLLRDVEWGALDVLVVDCPPGTGDEPLAVVQQMGQVDGAVLVTTPQQLSVGDVRRSAAFCQQLKLPVVGVVENMSGFICPHCGERSDIFSSGGGEQLARETGLPLLGSIPIDSRVVATGDNGEPIVKAHPESEPAQVFEAIVNRILETTVA